MDLFFKCFIAFILAIIILGLPNLIFNYLNWIGIS